MIPQMPVSIFSLILLFFSVFAHASPQPLHLEYGNHYRKPTHQTLTLKGDRLGRCFFLVLQNHKKLTLTDIVRRYPYLQNYLRGSTLVDYSTGREPDLKRIIMASADASVTPVQLFEWSLELNQGRLFESILTIHQLLRNEARFYRTWIHDYPSTKPKMIAFFNKFIDIRGDLEERGGGYHGDHRGSWYRIWGTMLDYLSMVAPDDFLVGSPNTVLKSASWLDYAIFMGTLTANLAEDLKPIIMYGTESDPRKAELNQVGYDTMDSMIRQAEQPSWSTEKTRWYQNLCDQQNYLIPKKQTP